MNVECRLGLWTLEELRNWADLIQLFKMCTGLSILKFDSVFEVSNNSHIRGHSLKLAKHQCRLDLRKYFFAERVIDRWNSLDQQTVDSSSLNSFKSTLTRTRNAKKGFFMDYSIWPSALLWRVDFYAPPTWWEPHQLNNQVNGKLRPVALRFANEGLYLFTHRGRRLHNINRLIT